jgi:hypothetical protein
MNADVEELAQYLWTGLTSMAYVALIIMQKNIQTLSFSALQGRTAWSVVLSQAYRLIPASGKTTLAHLLTERINLTMTILSLGMLTENCLRWKQNETSDDAPQPTSDVYAIPPHDQAILVGLTSLAPLSRTTRRLS